MLSLRHTLLLRHADFRLYAAARFSLRHAASFLRCCCRWIAYADTPLLFRCRYIRHAIIFERRAITLRYAATPCHTLRQMLMRYAYFRHAML